MTVDFALRLASAAARVLAPDGGSVLIGKDTRVSGYMFEAALEAGFVASGIDVLLTGPLPTPGIAYLTKRFGGNFGIVISGSHNPYYENGIKFFDREGEKLSDEIEEAIEVQLDGVDTPTTRESKELGQTRHVGSARRDYQEFCKTIISDGTDLSDLRIVIDASHGASYKVAPRVIAELGAEVIPVGCSPNGFNINDGCGSTHPELLKATVTGVRAQIGIALDGDGDRVVMVDEDGEVVDGDQLLYVLAVAYVEQQNLKGPVVGTVMSNLGLELALKDMGIDFQRASVGDRNVMAMLKEHGGILGGEASGHLICLDKTTTGDGLIVALQVLAIMKRTGRSLKELAGGMVQMPQTMLNVEVTDDMDPHSEPGIHQAITEVKAKLGDRGRVVLRASGTESVIRVMVEGENRDTVAELAQHLADSVRASLST
jgi:phosphoglucosamine mutase